MKTKSYEEIALTLQMIDDNDYRTHLFQQIFTEKKAFLELWNDIIKVSQLDDSITMIKFPLAKEFAPFFSFAACLDKDKENMYVIREYHNPIGEKSHIPEANKLFYNKAVKFIRDDLPIIDGVRSYPVPHFSFLCQGDARMEDIPREIQVS